MKLTISLEARFSRTPDQQIWSESGYNYLFWQRYLDIFEFIEVVARVQEVGNAPLNSMRADGKNVRIIALPCYIGPYQYLLNSVKVDSIVKAVVKDAEAVLLRTPGQVSSRLFHYLGKKQHLYGVEVVGDPYDVFAPGSVNHTLRFFFRWLGAKQLRDQCKSAAAAAYVTENALQKRYPSKSFTTHYSSINLRENAYATSPKYDFGVNGLITLIFVGTLAQLYKAPDILIDAVSLCVNKGLNIKLKIVGDGQLRTQLEQQTSRLALNNAVEFLGFLQGGDAIRRELSKADIFVLPSRGEGLPRAMIEAMAFGLPCIGTSVSGIPELLPPDDLVPPNDSQALADKIAEIITSPERMRTMSIRNLKKSQDYRSDILDLRRREFYKNLRDRTESWLQEESA